MDNIIKAIQKINSNAKMSILGNDLDSMEITWHEGTNPISKEDIEKQLPIVEQEIVDEAQAKIDKKASAVTKLKALGLDDDEINAIIGA